MATTELTSENFNEVVSSSDTLIIDFGADWCAPCKRFGPVFEAASQKHSDVVFAKLDTEKNQDVAAALEIRSIPTIMALKGGVLVYNEAGALNASQLEELLTQLEKLDIESVKQAAKAAQDEADAAAPTDAAN